MANEAGKLDTGLSNLERAGFILTAASLGVVQLRLLFAQALFSAAAIIWLIVVIREGRRRETPAFFVPLLVYALLTLASSAFSLNPLASFIDSRQLLLFLMVPVVARFARGSRAMSVMDVIIALGAAGALVGIVQYLVFGYDHLQKRPIGLLSHYMTFSGVLMLVICATAARLLLYPKEWIWPAIAMPALLVALAATQARNAWVGTFVALVCLVALRNWRLAVLVPIVGLLALAVAPAGIRHRALSTFDPNDPTNRDRVAMLTMGVAIARDYPVFGVGPEMIDDVYAKYRPPTAVNPTNPHLHNVPMQIVAERGVPALLAWIWFVIVAGRDLLKQVRQGPVKAVAGAGLAAIVAMVVAGMFEYNFGDSEFLMLFLGLITLPYAGAQQDLR